MGQVGGSRHYAGGGLGPMTEWKCPACGAGNAGPIEQGCQLCGSGKPGHRVEAPPPPPPPSQSAQAEEPDVFMVWLAAHPRASLQEAFTAGYVEGVRDARRQQLKAERQQRAEAPMATSHEAKQIRTLIAALELFRDQVLAGQPEEVMSGEWLSAEEVRAMVDQLREQESAHV